MLWVRQCGCPAADDPQHGFLPGNFDYLPNETEREDVMDPSRLQDPDKQMVRIKLPLSQLVECQALPDPCT